MLKVILTRGLPASGKSTWAEAQLAEQPGAWKRVSKDHLRAMLDGGRWSGPNEKFVLQLRNHIITEALRAGKHVIVDDTNFEPRHEQAIRDLITRLPDVQASVEVRTFDVSVAECLARDAQRANGVGADVILKMYHKYVAPPVGSIAVVEGLPSAIICDLDGTLALLNGRNPYDATGCENDTINTVVQTVVRSLVVDRGVVPLFVSGRFERFRTPTLQFLQRAFPHWSEGLSFSLYMRTDDDTRRDAIIKRELYARHITGKFNVLLAIDDRPRVIRECWRPLGIFVMDVGPGYDF